jgi:hypothetical protein
MSLCWLHNHVIISGIYDYKPYHGCKHICHVLSTRFCGLKSNWTKGICNVFEFNIYVITLNKICQIVVTCWVCMWRDDVCALLNVMYWWSYAFRSKYWLICLGWLLNTRFDHQIKLLILWKMVLLWLHMNVHMNVSNHNHIQVYKGWGQGYQCAYASITMW